MRKIFVVALLAAIGVTAFWAGSVVSGQEEETKKLPMPMPPTKPAEIKALDAFVGEWKSEFEFLPAMFGAPGNGTSEFHCEWVLDDWFVMGKQSSASTYGPYDSVWLATYDPKMGKYRSFTFTSSGACGIATMTYDPETHTWTAVSESTNMTSGKPAENKTTMRFAGKDKVEWEWHQRVEGQTEFTLMMKGTDTRVAPG
jgi:hypothetical protein